MMQQSPASIAMVTSQAGKCNDRWQSEISTYGRPVTVIWPQTASIDASRFRGNIDGALIAKAPDMFSQEYNDE